MRQAITRWVFLLLTPNVFFTPFRQSVKVLPCSYHQLWSDTAGFQFWSHHLLICQFSRKDILLNARLLLEPLTFVLSFRTSFPTILPLEDGTTDSAERNRLQSIFLQLCHLCSTSTLILNSLDHQAWASPLVRQMLLSDSSQIPSQDRGRDVEVAEGVHSAL